MQAKKHRLSVNEVLLLVRMNNTTVIKHSANIVTQVTMHRKYKATEIIKLGQRKNFYLLQRNYQINKKLCSYIDKCLFCVGMSNKNKFEHITDLKNNMDSL